jgi:heat shock protein HtpX
MTSAQSFLLVTLSATMLGLMGWLLIGAPFALMFVGGTVLLYLINPMVSPQVMFKLQRLRQLQHWEAPQLYHMLEKISKRARLPFVPQLYYSPSAMMNAFTIGNRKSAAIAISDGLLQRLEPAELSAVMAHEISHLQHNDMRIMGFATLSHQLVQILALIGQFFLVINLPLLLLGQYTISWMAILLLIFAPSLSAIFQLALSRTREYRADIGAAELIGDGRALASALAKMEVFHKMQLKSPFWPGYRPTSAGTLLRTHPPTKERIRRLMGKHDRPTRIDCQSAKSIRQTSPGILRQSLRWLFADN